MSTMVIEDFEGAQLGGAEWRSEPLRPDDKLTLTQVPVDQGHALRLAFAFSDNQPAALGYRIFLGHRDLRDFDHLALKVRSEKLAKDDVTALTLEFKRTSTRSPGMLEKGSGLAAVLSGQWRQVLIPLRRMVGIVDWSNVQELVLVAQSRRVGRAGSFLVDDIRLVRTGDRGPGIADPVATPLKTALEKAYGGRQALQSYLRQRLVRWPGHAEPQRLLGMVDDGQFLLQIARDTWRGLDSLTDREHALPIDNVRLGTGFDNVQDSRVGDYTNVTNIGLHFMSLVGANALGFIDRSTAIAKASAILRSLESLETINGFFYNYYDTTTLERTTDFVSFVDSAWLTAGLIVLRNALPELRSVCDELVSRGDYGFFYDNSERLMYHGYYGHMLVPSEYHYGALYAESRIGSLIGIGKGDVPRSHWFSLLRTFPPRFTWQTQAPSNVHRKKIDGISFWTGLYRWGNASYVPSWGGSMFEALMPTLVLDERRHAARSLGRNDEMHVALQRQYALKQLGYPVWGLSPSATPDGDGYGEYGVRQLGSRGYGTGAVTPHAAALALEVEPQAATRNLRLLAERYASYGDYGFLDALDPLTGKVAPKYLALNQAMLFIALVNHLRAGIIQKHFAADPIIQRVLPLVGRENFWD